VVKKRTEGGMFVRTKTTTRFVLFCKLDAILYQNKCSYAPILNCSPKCPVGGSTKRGISNRVFLAIFVTIFYGFRRTLASIAKSRQLLDVLCNVVQGEFSAGIALPFICDAFVF